MWGAVMQEPQDWEVSGNTEKEQVSKMVQIAVTLTADKKKMEVCIVCLYISNSFVCIMHYTLFTSL